MRTNLSESIEKEATAYFNTYDQDTLFKMLVEEWQLVESDQAPTHGLAEDYLKELVRQIAEGIVRNKDFVVATAGIITSEILKFMGASGYDLTLYRIAIAMLVALVAKALVGSLEVVMTDQ